MLLTTFLVLVSLISLAFFWFANKEKIIKNFKKDYGDAKNFISKTITKVIKRIKTIVKYRNSSEENKG